MDMIYGNVSGLDVHQQTILSCVRKRGPQEGVSHKKRALLAVGHTLLVIVYHMLKTGACYPDLGPDFFEKLKPEQYRRYLVKRLESLGYDVELKPKNAAA
jgi:hypothetical protein